MEQIDARLFRQGEIICAIMEDWVYGGRARGHRPYNAPFYGFRLVFCICICSLLIVQILLYDKHPEGSSDL
jgi:hypothetical protein